ncbi:MAG: V-type ATP synthase subunit F [Chloroflexota bacterium]
MARLVVIAGPALADGFRLAGSATVTARPGTEALAAVRSVLAEGDVGLVLVTADLWAGLEDRLRDTLEHSARPIVLPIPAGVVTDPTTRRQLLGEMLERAIGYRIELSGGERS